MEDAGERWISCRDGDDHRRTLVVKFENESVVVVAPCGEAFRFDREQIARMDEFLRSTLAAS